MAIEGHDRGKLEDGCGNGEPRLEYGRRLCWLEEPEGVVAKICCARFRNKLYRLIEFPNFD